MRKISYSDWCVGHSSAYRRFSRHLHVGFLSITFWAVSVASADRGDELLPPIQLEALREHIIVLQENVELEPERITYRTRSAYHRDAANNAAGYVAAPVRMEAHA